MAGARPSCVELRGRRRWTFADCVFDEANWSLAVANRRVAIETKPLELLRQLLLRAGTLVSKEELLGAIWPNVAVVEASLPTAIRKLRCALGDDHRDPPIIETVPRIGYRLAVPVEVEDPGPSQAGREAAMPPAQAAFQRAGEAFAAGFGAQPAMGATRLLSILGGLAIVAAVAAFALGRFQQAPAVTVAPSASQRDAANALRKLDVGAVEQMLAAGWDPNIPFDAQGNGAVNLVLNICEWDRRHDQSQLLLMVRTLIDGGARLDHRNRWGDTPYSIAKAVRYCGPNHPVTQSIRTMCYAGYKPLGDRCLASYEVARRDGA